MEQTAGAAVQLTAFVAVKAALSKATAAAATAPHVLQALTVLLTGAFPTGRPAAPAATTVKTQASAAATTADVLRSKAQNAARALGTAFCLTDA